MALRKEGVGRAYSQVDQACQVTFEALEGILDLLGEETAKIINPNPKKGDAELIDLLKEIQAKAHRISVLADKISEMAQTTRLCLED